VKSKNAQQKTVGQIDEKQPGDPGNAQQETVGQTSGQIVGHFPGEISVNTSTGSGSLGNAQRFAQQNAQRKIVGQITKKLSGKCPTIFDGPDGMVQVRNGLPGPQERRPSRHHPPALEVVIQQVRADDRVLFLRGSDRANG
jgi:hypothetical protein